MPALDLDDEAQAAAALDGLVEYFGEDDARTGVNLVIAGEAAGFFPTRSCRQCSSPRRKDSAMEIMLGSRDSRNTDCNSCTTRSQAAPRST